MLLAPGACFGIVAHGSIKLFIGTHRVLENTNRARECADLVATIAVRNGDGGVAAGNCFGNACDGGDWLGDAACDDCDAHDCERNRKAPEHSEPHGGMINAFVNLRIDLASRVAVVLAQRRQVFAERGPDFGWLIFSAHSLAACTPDCLTTGTSAYNES